jgi:predicted RNase H-like HicB family nuclease
MKREFSVIIERDSEGYYVARTPELRGCHTQARSSGKLQSRVCEAIELCLALEGDRDWRVSRATAKLQCEII